MYWVHDLSRRGEIKLYDQKKNASAVTCMSFASQDQFLFVGLENGSVSYDSNEFMNAYPYYVDVSMFF